MFMITWENIQLRSKYEYVYDMRPSSSCIIIVVNECVWMTCYVFIM